MSDSKFGCSSTDVKIPTTTTSICQIIKERFITETLLSHKSIRCVKSFTLVIYLLTRFLFVGLGLLWGSVPRNGGFVLNCSKE
jgi:hypothetical protein